MKIAFFGPRKIGEKGALAQELTAAVRKLIEEEGADLFLFGERDEFADLCYEIVTQFKENNPQLRRVCVRGRDEVLVRSRMETYAARYDEMCYPERFNGKKMVSVSARRETVITVCDAVVVYRGGEVSRNNIGAISAEKSAAAQNKMIVNLA